MRLIAVLARKEVGGVGRSAYTAVEVGRRLPDEIRPLVTCSTTLSSVRLDGIGRRGLSMSTKLER